jgi:ABC-2 type transport system permease protein
MMSLIRREFAAYFQSPVAYVVFGVFLLLTGARFLFAVDLLTAPSARGTENPMGVLFSDDRFWQVFLFIPALLTMRSFAEERGTGTLEVLLTAPIRDWQVVLGKFIAAFGFYKLLWLPTLIYLPVLLDFHTTWNLEDAWTVYGIVLTSGIALLLLAWLILLPFGAGGWLCFFALLLGAAATAVGIWGHYTQDQKHLVVIQCGIDPWPVLTTYIGVFLVGAMFLSLGIFVSSLVKSQMVAAMIALFLSSLFILPAVWQPEIDTGGAFNQFVVFFSVPKHFERDFARGVLDTRHLILYATVTLFFLFVTVRSLENRRWK